MYVLLSTVKEPGNCLSSKLHDQKLTDQQAKNGRRIRKELEPRLLVKAGNGLNAHAFKHGKEARKLLEQQVVWTECKL